MCADVQGSGIGSVSLLTPQDALPAFAKTATEQQPSAKGGGGGGGGGKRRPPPPPAAAAEHPPQAARSGFRFPTVAAVAASLAADGLEETECFACKQPLGDDPDGSVACTYHGCRKRFHIACTDLATGAGVESWYCGRHVCCMCCANAAADPPATKRGVKQSDFFCALCPKGYCSAHLPSGFNKVKQSKIGP